nr:hypothetical protein [Megavirus caiporensis]
MQIINILEKYEDHLNQIIETNGWIKTCRKQKQMLFIHITDGTSQNTLQIIVSPEFINNLDELNNLTTGTSIKVIGKLIASPAKGQHVELMAYNIIIYQQCDLSFPLQKVGLSLDFQRTIPHLRHRTNIMRAIFTIKSKVLSSIHKFFEDKNYLYIDIPALTINACEGGCQPLQVTSLLNKGNIENIPVTLDKSQIDYTQDFFNKPVYLTVSNQLHLECFAHGLGYVYTITPATRGEPSQSNKHLAHFSMLEVESCFGNLKDNINVAENCIKYCTTQILEKCKNELSVLSFSNKTLLSKLNNIVTQDFIRISHKDAVTLLRQKHEEKSFMEEPKYQNDLSGEHEKYLVQYFNNPVVVTHYPKNVKAFYMPVSHSETIDDKIIEYVDCFDLLMDIGETIGGSQRIWKEKELIDRMTELNIDQKHLKWYVDLRKYGSVPHGGFGLGMERLVAVLTGMANIKDCTSFPITINHCQY